MSDHIPFKEIRFKNRQGLSICVQVCNERH